MNTLYKIALVAVTAGLLSACGQQEEPAPAPVVITPDPVLSKY